MYPPCHDRRYAIDPCRISTELGWQPHHGIREGLATNGGLLPGESDLVPSGAQYGCISGGRLPVLARTGTRLSSGLSPELVQKKEGSETMFLCISRAR